MCRWGWVRRRKRIGATAAPVFESETGPVRAHPVLPQELLEPLLQLRLPNLPLVHGCVSPKTVAVVNAGVIEARHRGCCSAAGARALGQAQSPPFSKCPAGSPLAELPRTAPHSTHWPRSFPAKPRDIPIPIPIPCRSAPRSPPEPATNFSRQKQRAPETKPAQGAHRLRRRALRLARRPSRPAPDWQRHSALCPPRAVWREIWERRAGGGEMTGGPDHCDGARRGSG